MQNDSVKITDLNPIGNLLSANTVLVCVDSAGDETYKVTLQSIKEFFYNNSIQLPVYSSNLSRDTTITSPAAGMMIFVTGEGMQIRGDSGWNNVPGTA